VASEKRGSALLWSAALKVNFGRGQVGQPIVKILCLRNGATKVEDAKPVEGAALKAANNQYEGSTLPNIGPLAAATQ